MSIRRSLRFILRPAAVAAILMTFSVRPSLAQGTESIYGLVRSDAGASIPGATVSATMAPDRLTVQATTDSTGHFVIHSPRASGDYLLHVSAPGYKPSRQRVTRGATDTVLNVNVSLTPSAPAQLAAVNVVAAKLIPRRDDDPAASVGSSDEKLEGVFASLTPEQEGNLAAIAFALPGVSGTPDGLSVLGLSGIQSNATLNGMAFSGTTLPRDAQTTISVAISPYDPSRGGFSAAQTNVKLSPGNTYFRRQAHLTMDAPALQTAGVAGDLFGSRYTNLVGSTGSSGTWHDGRYFYNNAVQGSVHQSDNVSLFRLNDDALIASGIPPDSVSRLGELLAGFRVPSLAGGIGGSVRSEQLSFSSRFDGSPYVAGTFKPAPSTWNVVAVGEFTNVDALGGPLSVETRGTTQRRASLTTMGEYSRYLRDVLNESRIALSVNESTRKPAVDLPGGEVTVLSTLPAVGTALAEVGFGGNNLPSSMFRRSTFEVVNESQWYAKGNPHRIKLTLESRVDAYKADGQPLPGVFTFPSLSALASGSPSSYSRARSPQTRAASEWSAFAALSDYWRVSRHLQFLYGARIEGNRFLTPLAENPEITSLFGETTQATPERVHLSPRAGFTWYFGPGTGVRGNAFTRYSTQTLAPTAMLRGGIGEFRGSLSPSMLADIRAATGLGDGQQGLVCLGNAVPTPQWVSYLADPSNVPTKCADGTSSGLADTVRSVRLFGRSYDAARSWRGNLTLARSLGPVSVSLDGVYSLNLNQPGTSNLNFTEVPVFTLSDELRPVFVRPSSIVGATGLLSPADSRRTSALGSVLRAESDLRSTSRQLTASITPTNRQSVIYGLSYTLGDSRANARGFDDASFGSPSLTEDAPSAFDLRHQLQAYVGTGLPYGMNIGVFARFASGLPYTPMVNGDVNGDGIANDRAFVFSPLDAIDPAVRTAMTALLATAPDQARNCLQSQIGKPALRNSCRGPWTAYMNVRIGLVNLSGVTRRAFSASLNVSNPLSGLDQAVHGADRMQGWGNSASPDPVLLTVRGFDAASSRFVYVINPRFGSTSQSGQTNRAPFRVTLDMSFDFGVPPMKQAALKLVAPGRRGDARPRMSIDSIVSKMSRQVPELYADILEESDSLLISRDQAEALAKAGVIYRAKMLAHWRALATEFNSYGADFDDNRAMHVLDDAFSAGWLIARDELPTIESILSPVQVRLGPRQLGWLKQSTGPKYTGPTGGIVF